MKMKSRTKEDAEFPEVTPSEVLEVGVIGLGVATVTLTGPMSASKLSIIIVYIVALITQFSRRPEHLAAQEGWTFRKNSTNGVVVGSLLFMLVSHGLQGDTCQGFQSVLDCSVVQLMFLNLLVLLVCSVPNLGKPWIIMGQTVYALGGFMFVRSGLQGMPPSVTNIMDMFIFYPTMTLMFFSALLSFLPGSLTAGEALFITQILTALTRVPVEPVYTDTPDRHLSYIRKVCLTSCIHIAIVVKYVLSKLHEINIAHSRGSIDKSTADKKRWKWSLYFYLGVAAEIFLFELPRLYIRIGENPFLWLLDFILTDRKRIILINIWLILMTLGIGVVIFNQTSSTQVRKIFHILAVAVFIPGLYLDLQLLLLAATGLTCIFILTEYIRIFRVQPYGDLIHDALSAFTNEQDSGIAILTPMCLLIGLYQPLHYSNDASLSEFQSKLFLYSGVLSTGIGDTAASIIGSRYGTMRWPGSKKTIEGTLGAVVSQLIACVLLSIFLGVEPSFSSAWISITWVIILTSLLEAFTSQIDNLVLPSFMMAMFMAVS
ncbi:dolichol kinase [Strongylocentrotus purpuratus]|uniref:dolichol kinase n=1 Tax=Strongylocentrotus purpuratus TaxID=7668 RepID=A0A7M7HN61_STRPU|nr:dolichol kinase [Strongylocentrotus purpuratus]|eukprot:XP_011679974.1 PREDICTED: dolichol kinase [Strongylocentrotus purpuratus]